MYAADRAFWEHYKPEFAGECWTCAQSFEGVPGMNVIASVDEVGMSSVSTKIHRGGNSGFQSINLVANWGVSRIVLLGFDMQATGGRLHFHPDHPPSLGNPISLDRWVERFAVAARDLRAMGVSVINCSEQTALMCFERKSLRDTLNEWVCSGSSDV